MKTLKIITVLLSLFTVVLLSGCNWSKKSTVETPQVTIERGQIDYPFSGEALSEKSQKELPPPVVLPKDESVND